VGGKPGSKNHPLFFSIKNVDLKKQTISGTYYNETTGQWEVKEFPFPDVIYNRRAEGRTPKIKKFRDTAASMGIKSINPVNDFNKWELYCQLKSVPAMEGCLPHTVLYARESDIKEMLAQYNTIYLKPAVGRYSRKVVRVRLLPDQRIEYSYFDDRTRLEIAENWKQFAAFYQSFFKDRTFIVQEAIDVIRHNGQNIDFRAELQRNGQGNLEIVAISARMAAPDSPVTTTRAGTEVYKFTDFFKNMRNCSDRELNKLSRRVSDFLSKVYLNVEIIFGLFGDMGIDFALDQKLDLWLIECNAKSAKVALFMSYEQPAIHRSFLNPLEYAKFIDCGSANRAMEESTISFACNASYTKVIDFFLRQLQSVAEWLKNFKIFKLN
jgi:hypothetical protein